MCGIAGRVNRDTRVSARQLAAMSGLIAPRGPDGAGFFRDDRVGLAHRRLAIVDLEGGRQPVTGEHGRVVLVYNGEIFNHLELRRELAPRGHLFADDCDTEAVLHAHEEWGVGAAARLRGMFAYAAWERDARRLTLVRDHVGIKPLYYAHLPSGDLLFASDLKALLVEPAVDRAIDEEALGAYLTLRYVPAPSTIVRGVRKLEPGTALVWQDGRIAIQRWWTVPTGRDERPVPAPPPTYAEAAGRLTQLLDEVVSMWRMGDVPLGSFLSGGLDSTLITAILARLAKKGGDPTPCTFSVGYREREAAPVNELSFARRAAQALGTRHREVILTGREVAAELPRIAWDLDEPLGDPASIPLWFLTRRAREEVTIALSGEGADEVFAGYRIHGRALSAARMRERIPGFGAMARFADRVLPPGRLQRAARLFAETTHYRGVARAFDDGLRPAWGSPGAADRALAPSWQRAMRAATPLGKVLAFDQQVWLADDLLLKADKMTMAHALELRPPLLDVRLMEEVAAWPDEWKTDGTVGKKILYAAAEGLVPREILDRPKNGFGTPSGAWLRGPLRDMAWDLLLGPGSLACDRDESQLIESFLEAHASGRDHANQLWTLLSLEVWRDAIEGVPTVHANDLDVPVGAVLEGLPGMERSLVILLLDRDGQRSPIATAVRHQGHRLVIATGIETAQVVLGSLMPDVVVVRSVSPEQDRQTLARLENIAPEVPVRVIEAPAGLDEALEAPAALN